MGQRRGQLAQGGDAADVRQILPEPLCLELRLLARQRIGEDFTEEVELLDQLLRLRALRADRAEYQPSHHDPTDQ